PDAASAVGPAIRKVRLALGETPGKLAQRVAAAREGFVEAIDELALALERLATELALFAERSEDIGSCPERASDASARLPRRRSGLSSAADGDTPEGAWIRWVDVTQLGWQLHASPLSVAEMFSKHVTASGRAWILTSATLAVGNDFSLYQRELGLAEATT